MLNISDISPILGLIVLTSTEALTSSAQGSDFSANAIARSNDLVDAGKYREAEAVLRSAQRQAARADDSSVSAGLLEGELGFLYIALGRPLDASQALRRAATVLSRQLGEADPAVLRCWCNLTSVYLEMGADRDADRLLQQKLRPRMAELAVNSRLAVAILQNEATLCLRRNRLKEAQEIYTTVLSRLGGTRQDTQLRAVTWNSLGNVLLLAGDAEAARETLAKAAAELRMTLGPNHPEVATIYLNTAECAMKLHDYADAQVRLQEAIRIYSQALGADHRFVGFALLRYSHLLRSMKRKVESRVARQQAEDVLRSAALADHGRYRIDVRALAGSRW